MDTFKIKIVASNKVFYDGEAQSLSVPYIDGGSFTFLAHHCNAVVPIEAGGKRAEKGGGGGGTPGATYPDNGNQ